MRKKRTDIDFSNHKFTRNYFKGVYDYSLSLEGSRHHYVRVVVCEDGTAVYGDFGNWIFNKSFYPTANGYISDDYWIEKLEIASTQRGYKFCNRETECALLDAIEEAKTEYEPCVEQYYKDCLDALKTNSEEEYMTFAYDSLPKGFDSDWIVVGYVIPTWLLIIFDAFEEMCQRMENNYKNV